MTGPRPAPEISSNLTFQFETRAGVRMAVVSGWTTGDPYDLLMVARGLGETLGGRQIGRMNFNLKRTPPEKLRPGGITAEVYLKFHAPHLGVSEEQRAVLDQMT